MRIGGLTWLGVTVVLALTTGCTQPAEAPPPAAADAAVPSYRPPAGTPHFCVRLAASAHVDGVPLAVGMLTADPGNEEAVARLEDAVAELEVVLDDVLDGGAYDEISVRLEDLLAALHSATANPVDDGLRARISERLAAFGRQVQPLCEFPG